MAVSQSEGSRPRIHEPFDTTKQQIRLLWFDNISDRKDYAAETGSNHEPKVDVAGASKGAELDQYANEPQTAELNEGHEVPSVRLATFDLDDGPPYAALSYTWRKGGGQRQILLEGEVFTVGENLFEALRALRSHVKNGVDLCIPGLESCAIKWIWIDALCIDQENVQERNHQVTQMSAIYSGAEGVIAWLGIECTDAVRDVSCGTAHAMTTTRDDSNEEYPLCFPYGCTRICQADYWARVWIVQEFELAKEVCFAAGPHLLRLDDLQLFLESIEFALYLIRRSDAPMLLKSIRDRVSLRRLLRGQSLEALLLRCRHLQSHDPLDTIYGLLGLAGSVTGVGGVAGDAGELPEVDYSLSPLELILTLDDLGLKRGHLPVALRQAANVSPWRVHKSLRIRKHRVSKHSRSSPHLYTQPPLKKTRLS